MSNGLWWTRWLQNGQAIERTIGIGNEGVVMRARILTIVLSGACAMLLSGCAALMMSGGGGYEPASETCDEKRRAEGLCK